MTAISKFPSLFKMINTISKVQKGDILFPFAFDEAYCRRVGQGSHPVIHLWRHQKAFVLGTKDRRLPNALEAIAWLESQGYAVCTRNSGGAAVPLDSGVLNISLILPKQQGELDFHPDFKLMVQLIQESILLSSHTGVIAAQGEVKGSYCPGQFDLSIEGRKFCGIAQRRQTKAFIVQAFVVIEGYGRERARVAETFYQIASGGSRDIEYPIIEPGSMGSLYETANIASVESFVEGLKQALASMGTGGIEEDMKEQTGYMEEDQVEIQQMIAQLRERYDIGL